MDTSKISVIIPCYNAEQNVKKIYCELDKQSFKNLDIIFINDGSTDKTASLLDELANKDVRVRVIHQENKGVASARNSGLDLVKNSFGGGYIAFIDSDDEIDKDYFYTLYMDAIKYNADIVSCHFNEVEADGTLVELDLPKYDKVVDDREEFFYTYFTNAQNKERYLYHVWNKLYKKDIVLTERFDVRQQKGEDTTFVMRLLFKSPKVYLEDKRLYTYHRAGDCAKYKHKMFGGVIQTVEIYKMALKMSDKIRQEALQFCANSSVSSILWLARNRKYELYKEFSPVLTEWVAHYLKIGKDKKRRFLGRIYLKNQTLFYHIAKIL